MWHEEPKGGSSRAKEEEWLALSVALMMVTIDSPYIDVTSKISSGGSGGGISSSVRTIGLSKS